MNNILYIMDCTEIPNVAASSVWSMSSQLNKSNCLLLFDDSIHRDMYYNYFLTNHSVSNIFFIDSDHHNILLSNICEKYLCDHKWFIFLSPYVLYSKDFSTEIENLCRNKESEESDEIIFLPQHTTNKKTCSVGWHKNIIQNYIKQNLSYHSISIEINNLINAYINNAITIFNGCSWYDIEKCYTNPSDIYYKDKYCLIAKFIGFDDFVDSMVYINNKNYRCYNIANNLVGQIIHTNNNNITICWKTKESETKNIQYSLEHMSKSYIPT